MTQICAITGANGFVGGVLCRAFENAGWRVIKLVRAPEKAAGEARRFCLGEDVAPEILVGVDLLIHAAYDFSLCKWADIRRVNARGSEKLFDAAARAGVKRQIFISSMAAFEGCRSKYGRGKLAAEEAARARRHRHPPRRDLQRTKWRVGSQNRRRRGQAAIGADDRRWALSALHVPC